MATITEPMALDASFNTTETTPRSIADVLVGIEGALAQGMGRHANEVSYDNTTSGLSADDVQEAIDELAEEKVDKVTGKGLSTNDYTDAEKNKLAGIEAGAQVNPTIDSELSDSSTNAVQNKVVKGALDGKADNADVIGTKTVSGNPITLTDASETYAQSLVVELEPQQDLHGQSAPYVGGAGDNILEVTASSKEESGVTWTVESNGIIKVSGTASGYTYLIVGRAFVNSTMGNIIVSGVDYAANIAWAYIRIYDVNDSMVADITIQSAFGNVTVDLSQYPTAYKLDVAVKRNNNSATNGTLYLQVNKGTTVKPWTPYSNICPITGYTECNVEDVGKNLLENTASDDIINGITWTVNDDGSVTANGTVTGSSRSQLSITIDTTKVYGDLLVSCNQPNGTVTDAYVWDRTTGARVKKWDGTTDSETLADQTLKQIKIIKGHDCALYLRVSTQGSVVSNQMFYPMICVSTETDTTYKPYHSSNATIQFGQTVYGGSVDFLTGVLTVDRAIVDLGTLDWTERVSGSSEWIAITPANSKAPVSRGIWAICSNYPQNHKTGAPLDKTMVVNSTSLSSTSKQVWVHDSAYTDTVTFKAAMNGAQLVYELDEPDTIQLTPQELQLLKQYNNITTNGTTINLDYIPDNSIGDAVKASEEYTDRAVNVGIEKHLEMPYLRILDNNVDTPINNYRIYFHMIASAYTLVNMAEMLQHRFIFVEVIRNPSGTSSDELLHSVLIDPRTIDGFAYSMKVGGSDTIVIDTKLANNKFSMYLQTTGSYEDGDPTDYYVTIRMVD